MQRIAFSTPRLAAALCLGVLAGPVFAQATATAVDLRGPAPAEGTQWRTSSDMAARDGEMSVVMGGQAMQMKMEFDQVVVVELELLAMDGEEATRVRSTIVESGQDQTITFNGQEQTQTVNTEPTGTMVTYQRQEDGTWRNEVEGGSLPAEGRAAMEGVAFYLPRAVYPAEPIAVGESWTVPAEVFQAMMGSGEQPGASFEGGVTMTLVGVVEREGVSMAEIDVVIDTTTIIEAAGQGTVAVDMDATGKVYRNLEDYVGDERSFAGTMQMEMEPAGPGQPAIEMATDIQIDGHDEVIDG